MSGPLAGVRVLDLTRLLPGGYATRQLADLGAEVVKVEAPGGGDGVRYAPPLASTGESGAHLVLDQGKTSCVIDLKDPAGRDRLLALVRDADVLVESFRPGVMERLGLGPAVLAETNARLVVASLTAYGSDGPAADVPGHDIDAQALAGALSLGAGAEGAPAPPYLQVGDLASGLQLALGIVAALRQRDRTGAGPRVEVAMSDAVLSLLTLAAGAYAADGRVPGHTEALTGALACYGTYRCSDGGWLAVGALEAKFFGRLCTLVGRPELAALQYDPDRQDALRDALRQVFAGAPRAHWVDLLVAEDTCVAPVLDVAEALAEPNARRRGAVADVVLADGSVFPLVASPVRIDGRPGGPADGDPSTAPALAEGGPG